MIALVNKWGSRVSYAEFQTMYTDTLKEEVCNSPLFKCAHCTSAQWLPSKEYSNTPLSVSGKQRDNNKKKL